MKIALLNVDIYIYDRQIDSIIHSFMQALMKGYTKIASWVCAKSRIEGDRRKLCPQNSYNIRSYPAQMSKL